MHFYQNQINEMYNTINDRRQTEKTENIVAPNGKKLSREATLLELVVHVDSLKRQIKLISAICLTESFINSHRIMIEDEFDEYN